MRKKRPQRQEILLRNSRRRIEVVFEGKEEEECVILEWKICNESVSCIFPRVDIYLINGKHDEM